MIHLELKGGGILKKFCTQTHRDPGFLTCVSWGWSSSCQAARTPRSRKRQRDTSRWQAAGKERPSSKPCFRSQYRCGGSLSGVPGLSVQLGRVLVPDDSYTVSFCWSCMASRVARKHWRTSRGQQGVKDGLIAAQVVKHQHLCHRDLWCHVLWLSRSMMQYRTYAMLLVCLEKTYQVITINPHLTEFLIMRFWTIGFETIEIKLYIYPKSTVSNCTVLCKYNVLEGTVLAMFIGTILQSRDDLKHTTSWE